MASKAKADKEFEVRVLVPTDESFFLQWQSVKISEASCVIKYYEKQDMLFIGSHNGPLRTYKINQEEVKSVLNSLNG